MKASTMLASLGLFISILLALPAFSGLASPADDLNTYLPIAIKPLNGIVGKVTDDGVPAAGVALDLYLFNGASPAELSPQTRPAQPQIKESRPGTSGLQLPRGRMPQHPAPPPP